MKFTHYFFIVILKIKFNTAKDALLNLKMLELSQKFLGLIVTKKFLRKKLSYGQKEIVNSCTFWKLKQHLLRIVMGNFNISLFNKLQRSLCTIGRELIPEFVLEGVKSTVFDGLLNFWYNFYLKWSTGKRDTFLCMSVC